MEERRAAVGKREDRRVRRTRALLEQGLVQLLEKKPIREITVRELTNLIDINRGTFYLYYRDIYDMVEKIEGEYYKRLVEMLDAAREEKEDKRIRNGLQDFFVFIRENKDLCRVFLGENGDEAFLQKILLLIKEKCREQWPKTLNISDEEFEYRYSFAASGILGIVRYWLSVDCDQPAEKVALLAERCIMRGIIPHLKKEA